MTTISEIARRSGVSVGTVDRVLHDRGRVSEETRVRVRQIIKELDYKPNVIARNLSLKKTYTFAVLLPEPEQDGRYWELPAAGIQKAIDEIKMYKVDAWYVYYDKYSELSFREACSQIKSSLHELDGIVMAPVLSKASEKFVQELSDRVPYVFVDSYVHCSRCLSYIGQESFQSGVLAAKLMQLKLRTGKLAALRVLPEDYHIEDRVRGFCSVMEGDDSMRVFVFDADRREDPQVFRAMTVRILEAHPDIGGIFVPSACTHQVAEYLSAVGRSHDIVLIGYDLVEENRKFLKSGVIDFLISQRPALQGYQGIYSLYRHVILKQNVEPKMIVPIDILTRENLEYYQG
ncbi:MAG TPA: LacI family DNA-binding transcriptional regulator [bacterium]|nr:LacI family DNA-binding transcriptional regulator [bacterium]